MTLRDPHPEPEVSDHTEPPTDYEEHGLELVRAMRRAIRRGDDEEASRLRDELQSYGRAWDEAVGHDTDRDSELLQQIDDR